MTPKRLLPLLALVLFTAQTTAQQRMRFEAEKASVVTFNWGCSSPSTYPKKSLNRLVLATMKQQNFDGFGTWGDRAVALDLNGDRKREYFVPLDCGGTGNCYWGVFALQPLRSLGVINAERVYVHSLRGRWPELVTYGHLSAVEGSLTKYQIRKGRYREIPPSFPINHGESALDIQGGMGNKMPRFLEQAKPLCAEMEN